MALSARDSRCRTAVGAVGRRPCAISFCPSAPYLFLIEYLISAVSRLMSVISIPFVASFVSPVGSVVTRFGVKSCVWYCTGSGNISHLLCYTIVCHFQAVLPVISSGRRRSTAPAEVGTVTSSQLPCVKSSIYPSVSIPCLSAVKASLHHPVSLPVYCLSATWASPRLSFVVFQVRLASPDWGFKVCSFPVLGSIYPPVPHWSVCPEYSTDPICPSTASPRLSYVRS